MYENILILKPENIICSDIKFIKTYIRVYVNLLYAGNEM